MFAMMLSVCLLLRQALKNVSAENEFQYSAVVESAKCVEKGTALKMLGFLLSFLEYCLCK